ncbi:chromate transporter [Cohnella sp. GbtcB17]|uniref:chromate transporter n=1 Tax=Cohnella sp. GbtcB17 TaxID=2824762 RepID=UPI001C2F63C3|nr:chromate transporter [Cohnella sp. GbtcB17]
MTDKRKLQLSLFLVFLKMSPLTFGGGYALIPAIEREVVEKKNWLREEEIADLFAVSGTVPGAVAANSAAFIGYRIAGVSGAIAALLGICLPTFALMIVLSIFYVQFKDNPKIEAAFTAVRATVAALIAFAAIKVARSSIVDFASGTLAAAAALLLFTGIHPLWVIALGAIAGMLWVHFRALSGKDTKIKDKEPVYDYMI